MKKILVLLLAVLVPITGISSGDMRFDGVDDGINISDDNSLDFSTSQSFAYSMWFKRETAGLRNDPLLFKLIPNNGAGYRVKIQAADSTLQWSIEQSSGANSEITSNTAISDTDWHHMVFVRDVAEDKLYLYLDGNSDATPVTDTTTGNIENSESLFLGMENRTDANVYFNGSIDEVLIYNKSLTASEIQAMYASGGAWYPKDGLVSRWSMENNGVSTGQAHANGSTIKDSFGANNGTVADGADGSMTLESSPVRQKRGRR